MYTPKHFAAHEYVPEETYKRFGEQSFMFIDDRLLRFDDFLREQFGTITINNWYWNGDRMWSGLRTPNSPYYSTYSQHSFGKASDKIFRDVTAEEVRIWLKQNVDIWQQKTGIKSITLERGVSWVHLDVRNNQEGYNSFNP